MTILTPSAVATYLTTDYWREDRRAPRNWDVDTGGTIDVRITDIGTAEAATARLALMAWTTVSGIRFRQVGPEVEHVIEFVDTDYGAFNWSNLNYKSEIRYSQINVSEHWSWNYGNSLDSYYMQTMVHEIGHAMGLGHAGPYNGRATWGDDNWFDNDTWQMSIMSYFAPDDSPAVRGSYAYAVTPMPADIIAIHQIYGKPTGVGAGDTVYGWNSNAPGIYGVLSRAIERGAITNPVMMTIFDQGGIDTIDLSGDRFAQTVRLGIHQFSDILGLRGVLGIAYDTIIENFVAGRSSDNIRANDAANRLLGLSGDDTVLGLGGADSILGGVGSDSLNGGSGRDVIWGGHGDDRIEGANANDNLDGQTGDDFLDGEGGNDTLIGGSGLDRLVGGEGHDLMRGDTGGDDLSGGDGADSLYGGDDQDFIFGDRDDDLLIGGLGNDFLDSGDGSDRLMGSDGNDRLHGRAGADVLSGDSGNDRLSGGAGNDSLNGGTGGDRLWGGGGGDRLTGGAGRDTFIFAAAAEGKPANADRITDFVAGVDVLDFSQMDLTYVGAAAFSGQRGELRQIATASDSRLMADIDGDGIADFLILVTGGTVRSDDLLL